MASLMDELIDTLSEEKALYEQLIPVSEKKTTILVKDDLQALEEVTQQEQFLIEKAGALGKKRESVIANIAIVFFILLSMAYFSLLNRLLKSKIAPALAATPMRIRRAASFLMRSG